ncbi:MAG: N-acetylmuramoyl-L-alanine amidase [Epulopiscium sp.]|nr:N-acetylmuramoyl-L-alanine amidase [Candidatus Epulonipiscium sp.]
MNITEKFLEKNIYSRPGTKLKAVEKIVIHWVANPGTSAMSNRNYFNNLRGRYASAHYVIDINGSIIQCIPTTEVAYHAGNSEWNNSSVGIECCHPDWTGQFSKATMDSLIELCSYLCQTYKLDPLKNIYRHYDVTKKDCPKFYVENPEEFKKIKARVKDQMKSDGEINLKINGKLRKVKGFIKDGINYVKINNYDIPIRDVGESLGFQVSWESSTKTVIFDDK